MPSGEYLIESFHGGLTAGGDMLMLSNSKACKQASAE